MEWVRGDTVGHGSFATVNLAIPKSQTPQIPPLMAVKSCGLSHSASLMSEKSILDELNNCPNVIRCFGDNYSFEKGEKLYNVLLEFASGGALSDKIINSPDRRLPESDVTRYTRCILQGLNYIHKNGYVHCDIKLQNCLLFSCKDGRDDVVKIADFGLAKRGGVKRENKGFEFKGTPLYMSPEMVAGIELEAPADIWALGCLVAEMVTGAPAWSHLPESGIPALLMRIGFGEELPEIPLKLSEEGKDFLKKCFVKDPRKRWTAEMLLNHPFVAVHGGDHEWSTSPTTQFDFPDWESTQSSPTWSTTYLPSPEYSQISDTRFECELNLSCGSLYTSPVDRIRQLVGNQRPDWSVSDSWVTVR
ncbi:mitogen-activated protein kinase kinase kinase 20-like [Cornus florida]|uniref:mitogen-activated protein kinase kinase kinase 20-like n=1 Tax=Cornus florida TaxID=4283 RepID=UPI00289997A3|nr:mitogen-activated protein kinase kinase kinase 20-like [Cornus florida]